MYGRIFISKMVLWNSCKLCFCYHHREEQIESKNRAAWSKVQQVVLKVFLCFIFDPFKIHNTYVINIFNNLKCLSVSEKTDTFY